MTTNPSSLPNTDLLFSSIYAGDANTFRETWSASVIGGELASVSPLSPFAGSKTSFAYWISRRMVPVQNSVEAVCETHLVVGRRILEVHNLNARKVQVDIEAVAENPAISTAFRVVTNGPNDPDLAKIYYSDVTEVIRIALEVFDRPILAYIFTPSVRSALDILAERGPKQPDSYCYEEIQWSIQDFYYSVGKLLHELVFTSITTTSQMRAKEDITWLLRLTGLPWPQILLQRLVAQDYTPAGVYEILGWMAEEYSAPVCAYHLSMVTFPERFYALEALPTKIRRPLFAGQCVVAAKMACFSGWGGREALDSHLSSDGDLYGCDTYFYSPHIISFLSPRKEWLDSLAGLLASIPAEWLKRQSPPNTFGAIEIADAILAPLESLCDPIRRLVNRLGTSKTFAAEYKKKELDSYFCDFPLFYGYVTSVILAVNRLDDPDLRAVCGAYIDKLDRTNLELGIGIVSLSEQIEAWRKLLESNQQPI